MQSIARSDWLHKTFTLSPEEYDLLLLEPIQLQSVRSLANASLITDLGKSEMNRFLLTLYCEETVRILEEKQFTECGGLMLKQFVNKLQEEIVDAFGDELFSFAEVRKVQLISYLLSIPKDVTDVSAICNNVNASLDKEELNRILSLRV